MFTRVFAGTFNVSEQDATESLSPWLQCDLDIDVYVIGLAFIQLNKIEYYVNYH